MPRKLIIGILIALIINLLQASFTPMTEDEAYYWLWSQNLDWGYFDHPPMVAWWISLGYSLFKNELGVRLLTVILNAFSFYWLWKILNPTDEKKENLFWAIFSSVLVIQTFGFLTTPDAPLLFFTLLYLYLLKRFVENKTWTNTLLLGFSFAGLMYSKYHGILVIIFTLLPLVKILWKNEKFYAAIMLGLLFYFPHFNWLFQHEFLPIRYHFLERSSDENFEWQKLFNYIGMVLLGCTPLLSFHLLKSILKFKPKWEFEKSLWCLAIFPCLFFLISTFKDNVQPQWLLISFLGMAMVGYLYFSRKKSFKGVVKLGFAGLGIVLLGRIALVVPGISPFRKYENFGKNAGQFKMENAVFEKYQEASLYKFYNPERKVAIHRTLGNRRSQFNLWGWEEKLHGKTIQYVSPWIRGNQSFIGFKNRKYYIKEIPNYISYDSVRIEAVKEIKARPSDRISMKIQIQNHHAHPLELGDLTSLKLNLCFYQQLQYEIVHEIEIPMNQFILKPKEIKTIPIEFSLPDRLGNFKACFGLKYSEIGTAYLSAPISIKIEQ